MAFGRLGAAGTGFGRLGSTGSGGGVAAPAGGAALLTGEANGFAADFTYGTDGSRVAVKTAGTVVASTVDGFFSNAGTSPKMVYDASGVLGWSPHNLCPQSAAGRIGFEWSGNLSTRTGGQSDPLGGSEALLVTTTGNGGFNVFKQMASLPIGIPYVASMWIKGTASQQIYLTMDAGGTAVDQTLITFTGAWQRATMTKTATDANPYIGFERYNRSGGAHLPDVTFTIWGGQYQRGSVPTAYLPTTTTARYGLALDYDPVTHAARGLLCEPAATNMHPFSSDISLMTIEGGASTLNNQTGPEGTLTADTFTEDTAGGVVHAAYGNAVFTANIDYTVSRFMKMGTRRYATLGWSNGVNGAYAVYDLQSGVVGSSAAIAAGTLTSASMQACPNGWYRCVLTAKVNATTIYYTWGGATTATITPDGFGRQLYTGTSATLFIGHAQVEAGTVATSPIPTTSATVTRAVDAYNCTPASVGFNATAGSWWAETYLLEGSIDRNIVSHHTTAIPLFYNSSAFEMFDGTLLYQLLTVIGVVKRGMSAFTAGSRAVTGGGLAPATDAGTTTNMLTPVVIYLGGGGGGSPMLGYIRKVRYLPRRPSNAEMQTMTV